MAQPCFKELTKKGLVHPENGGNFCGSGIKIMLLIRNYKAK
jgi:hypothetical protein